MSDFSLTTGQICGLTHIPLKTLQRYVHDFREFFSESAQKPTKGRRFTQQDTEKLLLIRRLYFERTTPDRIRAALAGDWSPPAKPMYDTLDALNLVEAARQEKERSKDYSKKAAYEAQQAQFAVNGADHTLRRFREVIEKRDYFRDQVPLLLSRIDQLEKQIEQLKQRIELLQPKRRGLLDFFS